MIKNASDLAEKLGSTVDGLSRDIYKYTACGAWIELKDDCIKLGSIVEGSDSETETYTLRYPFTIDKFNETMQLIEDEADELWHEANDAYQEDEEEE